MSSPLSSTRFMPRLAAIAALLLGLCLPPNGASADGTVAATRPAHVDPGLRTILSTGTTVTSQPIHYPSSGPAKITAVEITLRPGEQTGWHTHPVPLFGYMLEGELTVDYGARGKRVYRKGDALAEAMNEAHNGRNTGKGLMRILAVFIGVEGGQGSVAAAPPVR